MEETLRLLHEAMAVHRRAIAGAGSPRDDVGSAAPAATVVHDKRGAVVQLLSRDIERICGIEISGVMEAKLGRVLSSVPEHGSTRFVFEVPDALAKFIAPKGSVAVDGVSLTVNEVDGPRFGVNIIPHTAAVTSLGTTRPGDKVNIEIDMLARYVARLAETRS